MTVNQSNALFVHLIAYTFSKQNNRLNCYFVLWSSGAISATPEGTTSPRESNSRPSTSPSSGSDVRSTTDRQSVISPRTSPVAPDSDGRGLNSKSTLGGVLGLSSQEHSEQSQPPTTSPKQLLSHMVAVMEKTKTKKTLEVSPPASTQSPQSLTKPSSQSLPETPAGQTSPVVKQQPMGASGLKLKTPSPVKVVQTTTKSGATRLPFAVGGKFSLMPEEMESLMPGRSVRPPVILQSARKKYER